MCDGKSVERRRKAGALKVEGPKRGEMVDVRLRELWRVELQDAAEGREPLGELGLAEQTEVHAMSRLARRAGRIQARLEQLGVGPRALRLEEDEMEVLRRARVGRGDGLGRVAQRLRALLEAGCGAETVHLAGAVGAARVSGVRQRRTDR